MTQDQSLQMCDVADISASDMLVADVLIISVSTAKAFLSNILLVIFTIQFAKIVIWE